MNTELADTRQRLILAARDLFWLQGYHATAITQILTKAEAKSGSLYYFFPTKEDLLLAVLEWYRDNLDAEVVRPVVERVSDPVERIFGILAGYRQMLLATNYTQGCPIGNLALELSESHPAARRLISLNFANWAAVVESMLQQAAARLPSDVDPRRLANFVLTVMEGGVMLTRAQRSMDPFDAAVEELRVHFDLLLSRGREWVAPPRN